MDVRCPEGKESMAILIPRRPDSKQEVQLQTPSSATMGETEFWKQKHTRASGATLWVETPTPKGQDGPLVEENLSATFWFVSICVIL